MDTEGSISPREAAQVIGVHPNSIRTWCKEFSAFLSVTANPGSEIARRLTGEDIAQLKRIRILRDRGKTFEEIAGVLRGLWGEESSGPVVPSTAVQNVPDGPSSAVVASAVIEALDAHLAAFQRPPDGPSGAIMPAAVVQALEALQSRLDAPPAAQALQNARAQGFAAGVVVAVGIMLGVSLLLGILASLGLGWVARLFLGG